MEAKFIGKDKSMGFEFGKIYTIKTWLDYRSGLFGKPIAYLFVQSDSKSCPYSSLEAMLTNWELIK